MSMVSATVDATTTIRTLCAQPPPLSSLSSETISDRQTKWSCHGRSYRCQDPLWSRSVTRSRKTSRAMNRFKHRKTSFFDSPSA